MNAKLNPPEFFNREERGETRKSDEIFASLRAFRGLFGLVQGFVFIRLRSWFNRTGPIEAEV